MCSNVMAKVEYETSKLMQQVMILDNKCDLKAMSLVLNYLECTWDKTFISTTQHSVGKHCERFKP